MSTSDYKAQAELAKTKLNTVSPTMCLAKWNQVSLHLPTGLTNSCYHPPLHKINKEEIAKNNGWIKSVVIKEAIKFYGKCEYSKYLSSLI